MTLSKNIIINVEEFLIEFASKKFVEDDILVWAMSNLPNFSKDTFYFFKKTLKLFYHSVGSSYLVITCERVSEMYKNNPKFLKKFNAELKV